MSNDLIKSMEEFCGKVKTEMPKTEEDLNNIAYRMLQMAIIDRNEYAILVDSYYKKIESDKYKPF